MRHILRVGVVGVCVAAVALCGAACDGGDLRSAIPEEVAAGGTLTGGEAQSAFVHWIEQTGRHAPVPLRADYRFAVEARGVDSGLGGRATSRMSLRVFADDRVRMDLFPEGLEVDPEVLGDSSDLQERQSTYSRVVFVLDGDVMWAWVEMDESGKREGVRMKQQAMEDAWGAMMQAIARLAAEFRVDEGPDLSLEYRGFSSTLSGFLHPARSVQALATAAECHSMEMADDRLRCRLALHDREQEVLHQAGSVLTEHLNQLMLGRVLQALAAESLLVEFDPEAGTVARAELTHEVGREMFVGWLDEGSEDVRTTLTMELLEQGAILDGGEDEWLRPPEGLEAEDVTLFAQLAATALRTFRLR